MTTPRCSSACHIMLSSPRYLSDTSLSPQTAGQGCWVAPVAWVCQQWGQQQAGNCLTLHLSVVTVCLGVGSSMVQPTAGSTLCQGNSRCITLRYWNVTGTLPLQ